MKRLCLNQSLLVGAMLFGIGMVGFLSRRNMIVMFLAAEMMLQGVSLSLVAWGRFHNDCGGQMLVIFILAVAACEAAIALALVLMLFIATAISISPPGTTSARATSRRSRHGIARRCRTPPQVWPHLTPAGIKPPADEEDILHRHHV